MYQLSIGNSFFHFQQQATKMSYVYFQVKYVVSIMIYHILYITVITICGVRVEGGGDLVVRVCRG